MEELLCLPTVTWNKLRAAPWPVVEDVAEAEQAASGLRGYWGLGGEPVANLADLLERQGTKTLAADLKNVDALAGTAPRKNGEAATAIVVNQAWPGERQRFAMACELGHMLLAISPGVSSRIAAGRFAGAFLMPGETLRAEVGARRKQVTWGELLVLKQVFGASLSALIYRCRDLRVFGRSLSKRLLDELSAQGWRDPPYAEPGGLPAVPPTRVSPPCSRAGKTCESCTLAGVAATE